MIYVTGFKTRTRKNWWAPGATTIGYEYMFIKSLSCPLLEASVCTRAG